MNIQFGARIPIVPTDVDRQWKPRDLDTPIVVNTRGTEREVPADQVTFYSNPRTLSLTVDYGDHTTEQAQLDIELPEDGASNNKDVVVVALTGPDKHPEGEELESFLKKVNQLSFLQEPVYLRNTDVSQENPPLL